MNRPSLLLLVALGALGACQKEGDAATAAQSVETAPNTGSGPGALDPCSLVTKAEAEAAMGGPVTGPERNSGFGQFEQCQYLFSGERLADMGMVTVQVARIDLPSQQKAFAQSGQAAEPVSGIGEGAFWAPDLSALYVAKGPWTVSFSAARNGQDARAASRALAEKGLSRMP